MAHIRIKTEVLDSDWWRYREGRGVYLTMAMMAKWVDMAEPFELEPWDEELPPGPYGVVNASTATILERAVVDDEKGRQALEWLAAHKLIGRVPGGHWAGAWVLTRFDDFRRHDRVQAVQLRVWRKKRKAAQLEASHGG